MRGGCRPSHNQLHQSLKLITLSKECIQLSQKETGGMKTATRLQERNVRALKLHVEGELDHARVVQIRIATARLEYSRRDKGGRRYIA